MLTLYVRPGCLHGALVLKTGEALGLTFNVRSITEEGVAEELIARGGKQQMPYLVDDERGVEMYESEDIAAYLREHYSSPKTA